MGFSPFRVQSIQGWVHSRFSPFEVQSIRGLVFLGSVILGSVVLGLAGKSILGINFLRKFKVIVAPEISQINFACTTVASPVSSSLFSVASSALSCLSSTTPIPAPVPVQLPTWMTSPQPPVISAHVVRNPEAKSSSFSLRENNSLVDLPPA